MASMDKNRALLALQRRQQQPIEVHVMQPQPVRHPRRITFPDAHPEILMFGTVLITAIISLTILGAFWGVRGIIYELRRNPDSSTCLFNCHE